MVYGIQQIRVLKGGLGRIAERIRAHIQSNYPVCCWRTLHCALIRDFRINCKNPGAGRQDERNGTRFSDSYRVLKIVIPL